MNVFTSAEPLQKHLLNYPNKGFVPTMGALHEGHFSLIKEAILHQYLPIVSIFVNPAQFNDINDFHKYPSTIAEDLKKLHELEVPVVFLPKTAVLYPNGWQNLEKYELGTLENLFEGAHRPGHFQGVCQILSRLFQLIEPQRVYMGQKDFQQCMVVKKLLQLLHSKAELVICPTIREQSGLAKSSRNMRLSETEKSKAAHLYKNLKNLQSRLKTGNEAKLLEEAIADLERNGFKMEYLNIAETDSLTPLEYLPVDRKAVLLAAGWMGDVRLIDNLPL